MNILLIDGFDLYNGTGANTGVQTKWSLSTTSQAAMVAGRFDGQAFGWVGSLSGDKWLNRPFSAASASISLGFAYNVAVSDGRLAKTMHLLSSGTYMIGLTCDSLGVLTAGRFTAFGSFTALGSSAAGVIKQNTWHYVEVEAVISDTVGVFNVYVDGVSVLALTNVDTRNGTPTTVNQIQFSSTSYSPASFDDVYVTDTAIRLGERRIQTLRPGADTATKSFIPSTGVSNYALVDDAVADSADYVSGSAVGDLDLYEIADIGGTPSIIDAVQLTAFAHKTDAASRNIALVGDIAGAQIQSSDFALASGDAKFDYLAQIKPGGGAWDLAAVNALRIGPKVTL